MTFKDVSTYASIADIASHTVTRPATNAVGDLLVACASWAFHVGGTGMQAPAGWTQRGASQQMVNTAGLTQFHSQYSIIIGAGPPATDAWTFQGTGTGPLTVVIAEYDQLAGTFTTIGAAGMTGVGTLDFNSTAQTNPTALAPLRSVYSLGAVDPAGNVAGDETNWADPVWAVTIPGYPMILRGSAYSGHYTIGGKDGDLKAWLYDHSTPLYDPIPGDTILSWATGQTVGQGLRCHYTNDTADAAVTTAGGDAWAYMS